MYMTVHEVGRLGRFGVSEPDSPAERSEPDLRLVTDPNAEMRAQTLEATKNWKVPHPIHNPVDTPSVFESLAQMPSETARRVSAALLALTKKYYVAESGDLRIITNERVVDGQLTAMHTIIPLATRAIDLASKPLGFDSTSWQPMYDSARSWNSIDPLKPNEDFMLNVGGEQIDGRAGMNLEVAQEIAARNPAIRREGLWATGNPELVKDGTAPYLYITDGRATQYDDMFRADDGHRQLAYRPVVIIESQITA